MVSVVLAHLDTTNHEKQLELPPQSLLHNHLYTWLCPAPSSLILHMYILARLFTTVLGHHHISSVCRSYLQKGQHGEKAFLQYKGEHRKKERLTINISVIQRIAERSAIIGHLNCGLDFYILLF